MLRINWFAAGDRNFASSRLRVWQIADAINLLHWTDYRVAVYTDEHNVWDADIIVVQKRWDLQEQIKQWHKEGKKIIFDIDDMINVPIPDGIDLTTVDTAAKLDRWPNAVVIPDALDLGLDSPKKVEHRETLAYVTTTTNSENVYHLRNAARACEALGLVLEVFTNIDKADRSILPHRVIYSPWSLDKIDSQLVSQDLFIAPFMFNGTHSSEWIRSKSANRILKAYGLGLPIIATSIPSYEEIGLYCAAQTVEEWIFALNAMQDQKTREDVANRGYDIAWTFSADRIVNQWLEVFEK